MSTFDTTKNPLQTIIKQISEGKIQLPDFQSWAWDDLDAQDDDVQLQEVVA